MDTTTLTKADISLIESLEPILEDNEVIENLIDVKHLNMRQVLVFSNKRIFLSTYTPFTLAQKKNQPVAFSRYFIKEITYTKLTTSIKFHLSDDVISFKVANNASRKEAQQLAESFNQVRVDNPSLAGLIDDIETLEKNFNVIRSADSELGQISGPYNQKLAFLDFLAERKISLRVTAVLLSLYFLLLLLIDIRSGFSTDTIIDSLFIYPILGWFIFSLWTYRPNARWWVMLAVFANWLFVLLNQFPEPYFPALFFFTAFLISILLLLAGKPKRIKTVLGALIIPLYFVGSLVISFISYMLQST